MSSPVILVLASKPFWPKPAGASQPEANPGTRFAPHWGMMLAMILLGITLLAGLWHIIHVLIF